MQRGNEDAGGSVMKEGKSELRKMKNDEKGMK